LTPAVLLLPPVDLQAHLAEAQSGPLSSPTAAGDAAGGIGDKHEQQLRTSITERQLKVR
jgi:hypothetical protein